MAQTAVKPLRQQFGIPSSQPTAHDQQRLAKKPKMLKRHGKKVFMVRRISRNDRIFFIDNLATMLNAGLTLSLALRTLIGEAKHKAMRLAIEDIERTVDNGNQFSEGLLDHPEIFSPLFIAVVRVGETGGKLGEVLTRLTEIAKKERALRSKVINALIYPAIVSIAMVGIVVVLMLYVFPQLISIFKEVNVALPLQTRILIGTVGFLQEYGIFVGFAVIALFFLFLASRKIRSVHRFYHAVLLRLPFIGGVVRELSLTRLLSNLQMMMTSGVPIVQAFTIGSETAGNLVYEDTLLAVAKKLELGNALHTAFAEYPSLFPSLTVTMAKVGEETGTLDEIMGKLQSFYEQRVENIFANLSTIIEPAMLIVIGIMVGFIAVSVILPIYDLAQAF